MSGQKDEDPRDLWGRSAGAPRSLLSLLDPRAATAEATDAARMIRGVRTMSNAQVSGRVDVAPQADREDGTDALQAADRQRVDVVGGEVRVLARLEAPLLVLLMCQPGAAEGEHTDRLLAPEPLFRVVVALERCHADERVDRRDRGVRAGPDLHPPADEVSERIHRGRTPGAERLLVQAAGRTPARVERRLDAHAQAEHRGPLDHV